MAPVILEGRKQPTTVPFHLLKQEIHEGEAECDDDTFDWRLKVWA
jgi:hypothetical protein